MSDGRPSRALIDTDILRAYRIGDPDALAFMSDCVRLGHPEISQLSAMALIADAPDAAERTGLGQFFSWCQIHSLTAKIVRRAQAILESLPPPCGLIADDASSPPRPGNISYSCTPSTRRGSPPSRGCPHSNPTDRETPDARYHAQPPAVPRPRRRRTGQD